MILYPYSHLCHDYAKTYCMTKKIAKHSQDPHVRQAVIFLKFDSLSKTTGYANWIEYDSCSKQAANNSPRKQPSIKSGLQTKSNKV